MAKLFFHLLLTTKCDLKCRYCYEKSCDDIGSEFGQFKIDFDIPEYIIYKIDTLKKFLEKDPKPILIFYGGEPLLDRPKIKEIMDNIKANQFNIQTNGLHLDKLESDYINRLSTIFVSIDGKETITDYYRGKGVYKEVIKNINIIKKNGFEGEIVARMTLMEETKIYENIRWLLKNSDYPFNSIHWQIDAGFWKNDFHKKNFGEWVQRNYNPEIKKLVKFWVDAMEKKGQVLKLYPLLGVMKSLLLKEKSLLRCGSGWINYSIQTNGYIIPCPSMNGMKDYYIDHIKTSHPLKLEKKYVTQPCIDCDILNECGGRCIYANITKQWSNENYDLICNTVRNLFHTLKKEIKKIKELINEGKISLSDFDHIKYNSCEIIP